MDEKHILLIQQNYMELIQQTDLDRLLPLLINCGVYSHRIVEPYQDKNISLLDRKRRLFANIHRRGPEAFEKLVTCLRNIGDFYHNNLANLLEGKQSIIITNTNNNYCNSHDVIEKEENDNQTFGSGAHPFRLTESQRPSHIRQLSEETPHANINLKDEPLIVNVRKADRFYDNPKECKVPIYPMRSKLRGLYLGINNMSFINDVLGFRDGAQVDEKNLNELFTQMGFECNTCRNQTKCDFQQTIKNFTNSETNPSLKRADCLVVAIMSHGEEGDTPESSQVISSDGKRIAVSEILEYFNNINCPSFHNKPKIFLFQICRGDNKQRPVSHRVQADGVNLSSRMGTLREMTDMLVAWSTLPGDRSYRDTNLGTWYMQLVCEVFMNHAYDTDVELLLKMVDDKLKHLKSEDGNMQTSSYESRAFKVCFLHPGLYE